MWHLESIMYLLTAAGEGHDWPTSSAPSLIPLFLLLLAVPLVWYIWRRRLPGPVAGNRKLKVSESCIVGPRQFIIVAAYEDQRVLIGVSPGQINYLCRVDAAGNRDTEPFQNILNKEAPEK